MDLWGGKPEQIDFLPALLLVATKWQDSKCSQTLMHIQTVNEIVKMQMILKWVWGGTQGSVS